MDLRKKYMIAVAGQAFLCALISTLIGITVIYKANERREYTYETEYCLPCFDVRGHPDDGLSDGIEKFEGGEKCCAKNETYLPQLIEAYVNVWQDRELKKENPKLAECRIKQDKKPLIKLHLKGEQSDNGDDELQWEIELERQHDKGNLQYENGYITVHQTGYYHVYSQVAFQHRENVTRYAEFPKQHLIWVNPIGTPKEELKLVAKGSNTQCQFYRSTGLPTYTGTSFIGTAYQLNRGDRVVVKVHDRTQLLIQRNLNVFGIHMI